VAGTTLRLPSLHLPRLDVKPENLIYSLNNFAASALALYISFAADLPRPYWAVLTVYITAQPLTGALRSKAVYRVIGTVIGAGAAVVLVPNLVNSPIALSAALAVWVGLCLFIALLDRTPRAYAFLLSGYTAGIIGFPTVDTPELVFDTAVSRVEEITVGILCATLIHSIFFPREVTVALNVRVARFLGHARTLASGTILSGREPQSVRKRCQLAADVTELQILATHLPFDTSNFRPRRNAVRALRDSLALLLPYIAAVEDRLDALRRLDAVPRDLEVVLRDVVGYLGNEESTRAEADDLTARSMASIPRIDFADRESVWPRMLATSAAVRLSELVGTWQDSLVLAAFVRDPTIAPPRLDALLRRRSGRRPLHLDRAIAALSAWAAMAAIFACCAAWISTAWPSGAVAAQFAAIFSSFFAQLEDPAAAISRFLFWVIIAMPITAFYLFAVLPAIDGYTMLVLALSPFYLVTGYMQGDATQFLRAMPLIIGFTGTLAVQETYEANFADFANSNLALIIGVGVALWSTQLFRSVGAAWSIGRMLRSGREDLSGLAAGRRFDDRDVWTSLMLDRLGLIAPRAQIGDPSQDLAAEDLFLDLRAGLNIIALRETGWRPQEVDDLTARLSEAYAARSRDAHASFAPHLLAAIDAAISAFGRVEAHPARAHICSSLVGLRRTLFPDAPGYR
jgi:uncharacterized membrane protein YccC